MGSGASSLTNSISASSTKPETRSKSARPANNSRYSNNKLSSKSTNQDDRIVDYRIKSKKVSINDDTITRFIQIQSKLELYEQNGVFEDLRIAEEEVETVKNEKKKFESNYRSLNEKLKQQKDLALSKGILLHKKEPKNVQLSNEQKEYLHCMSDFEQATIDLKLITEQYNHSKAKLEEFRLNNQYAIDLYNEQMHILDSTFEGEYGSELEFKLENEVKNLTDQKDQLKSALIKWGYARYLLVYSYEQLKTGELQWSELMSLQLTKTETILYTTEVKNNLIAAYQNLANAKSYLKNVNFPYLTEEDLINLQSLADELYEYMSEEGHVYVMKEVQIIRKKCAQLNEWFESVVKMFIPLVSEYTKVKKEFEIKSDQLKIERIRLLQQKVREKVGKSVNMHMIEMVPDSKEKTDLSLILGSFKSNLILVDEAKEKINMETNESAGCLNENNNNHISKNTEMNSLEQSNASTEQSNASNYELKIEESKENEIEHLKNITRDSLPMSPAIERLPSNFEMPLPASREELLHNLESIKEQYRLQEKTWNHLLTSSRQAADEKLKRMLDQYK